MKRTISLLLACVACGEGSAPVAPASRVEAVAAKPPSASAAELCDKLLAPEQAPKFTLPEVEGTPPSSKGPRWINVWATWCPPCVEELPVLRKMEAALQKQGAPVKLTLLSVDATPDAVSKFAGAHPEVQGSLRLKDEKALEPWLASLGLDRGATLPVHVFVGADEKIVCVRTGAIKESDQAAVAGLLNP